MFYIIDLKNKTIGNRNYIFVCNPIYDFDKQYIVKNDWRAGD